jgi:Uma2 family endonuclease
MATTVQFTYDEFDRMVRQGVFEQDRRRLELIRGEIREMTPPGPLHEDVIDRLTRWSIESVRAAIRVRVQNSIGLPDLDTAPQPDVAWVREQDYRHGRPVGSDVLLVIEVADSSLPIDRGEKQDLYAHAGIQEYWIVNLPERRIEVYREPSSAGFRQTSFAEIGETLSPLADPQAILDVTKLLGV